MRAALYVRVSTDEQAREGVSIAAQQQSLLAYCRSQGWSVADVFVDDGASGKDLRRPALQSMLAKAQEGAFDVVLAWKVDRLSRRLMDLLQVIQGDLEPRGIGFRSATEAFDTASPLGKTMLQLLGAFAELERENIRERTRSGMAELARRGRWLSGRAPYGYAWTEGRTLEPDPAQVTGVAYIFGRAAAGDGLYKIAADMQAAGWRSPEGGPWDRGTIRKILRSRVYRGEVRHRGRWLPGSHPALVTEEQWRAADAVRATKGNRPTGRSLLGGIALCGGCGGRLYLCRTRHGEKQYSYYRCYGCGNRSREDQADAMVLRAVCELPFNEGDFREAMGAGGEAEAKALRREDQALARSEADATRRHDVWLKAVEDGQMTFAEVRERMDDLRREAEQHATRRREIAGLLQRASIPASRIAETRKALRQFCRDLPAMPPEEQRAILRRLIAWVRIEDGPALGDMRLR